MIPRYRFVKGTMFSTLLILLIAFLDLGYCLPWAGPQETAVPTSTANWSPAPTNSNSKDNLLHQALKRGAYPGTVCGWILQGKDALPVTCSTRSSCAWNSDYGVVGCCATESSFCKFYTACIDFNSPQQQGDKDDVYTCKGASECYSNVWLDGYSQWGCGKSKYATTIVTSYDGINKDLSLAMPITGVESPTQTPTGGVLSSLRSEIISSAISKSSNVPLNSNPSNPDTETPDMTNTQKAATTQSASGGVSNNSDDNPDDESTSPSTTTLKVSASSSSASKKNSSTSIASNGEQHKHAQTPIGPIVGGVVGGVALLGLLAAFLVWRRSSRKNKADKTLPVVNNTTNHNNSPTKHDPPMATTVLDSNPVFEVSGDNESRYQDDPKNHGTSNGSVTANTNRFSHPDRDQTVSPLLPSPSIPSSSLIPSPLAPRNREHEPSRPSELPDALRVGHIPVDENSTGSMLPTPALSQNHGEGREHQVVAELA